MGWTELMLTRASMFYVQLLEFMIDIVFKEQFQGVNKTDITDWDGLKRLGDQKINTLIQALNDSGSLASPTGGETGKSVASFISTPIWLTFILLISTIIWNLE